MTTIRLVNYQILFYSRVVNEGKTYEQGLLCFVVRKLENVARIVD